MVNAESIKFTAEDIEWFEREVRPILVENCQSCHSEAVGNVKGELNLDNREAILTGGESGAAVEPGDPDASILVEAIRRESFEMPPEKALANKDTETLVEWVRRGAPWPEKSTNGKTDGNWLTERTQNHWAWQTIQPTIPPVIPNDRWSKNAIDKFVLAKLNTQALQPTDQATQQVLLRRLCYDLTGLPPSAEQIEAGKHIDNDQDYAQLVEQLLASPQLGVKWGRHWLDLMRYAETLGHEFDYPIHHAWRYRDAVIDAINDDIPYSTFISEHIAGDRLPQRRHNPLTGVDESLALTGWWWLGDTVHAPVDITNDWATRIDNQIDVFSKTFIGMTVACARCHDHKFDAIGQRDYYGLSGIIESSRRQYANTDPHGKIAAHNKVLQRNLKLADEDANSTSRSLDEEELQAVVEELLVKLASIDGSDKKLKLGVDSAFLPLKIALEAQPETGDLTKALKKYRSQLRKAKSIYQEWLDTTELYADFSNGLPEGWRLNRASELQQESKTDWFTAPHPLPAREGIFSSASYGTRQWATLSSPSFTVPRTAICIKLRGKSVQSSVVASNYFMGEFHTLLFKDLYKQVDQPRDSGWVTHKGDLNKYVDHPAFLQIFDQGDGWFEIEEVRFADSGPPTADPSSFASRFLEETTDENLAEFIANFSQHLSHELESGNGSILRELAAICDATETENPLLNSPAQNQWHKKFAKLDLATPKPTVLLATEEGTPTNGAIAIRGNPHDRGESLPRESLAHVATSRSAVETSSGRLELAQTLVDPEHPLTARVMVNRVWKHMFGRGLVVSPDNFGVLGGRPSHPKLLDYLTQEFIDHDWSVKWLIREITVSSTYQLSSVPTEIQLVNDAEGTLLSHRSVKRLSSEEIRDSMLHVAGSLNTQLAGPSIPVYLSKQMTGRGRPKKSGPLDGGNRRSTFVEVRRNFLNPFLVAFDFPMPSTATGRRNISNVPAQALGMLNDPLVLELTDRWAKTESQQDSEQRIQQMFLSAFGRAPTESEVALCRDMANSDADWNDLAHVLLNSKEFLYLR